MTIKQKDNIIAEVVSLIEKMIIVAWDFPRPQ